MRARSIRHAASLIGLSHVGLRKAILAGRVTREPDGTFDTEKVRVQLAQNTHPGRGKGGSTNGYTPDAMRSYQTARAIRESFDARIRELEYQRASGELVSKSRVEAEAFTKARRARNLLLSLAARVGPVVAGLSDPRECISVLEEELRRVAEEIEGDRDQAIT